MKIVLETERLILRQFTKSDADVLFTLDNDPQVMQFINGGVPTSYQNIVNNLLPMFFNDYYKYDDYGVFAAQAKRDKKFIGLFNFRPSLESVYGEDLELIEADLHEIELGYRLLRQYWGKGYGTEASRGLIEQGFHEWGVKRVVAWTLQQNIASWRVMEKVGLKREKEFSFLRYQLPNIGDRAAFFYRLNREDYNR